MSESIEPKNLYSYVTSILKTKTVYALNPKLYSQFMINQMVYCHKDNVEFVNELFNDIRYKYPDIVHYNTLREYLDNVGGIYGIDYKQPKTTIEGELFSHFKMSSRDIKIALQGK